MSDLDMHIAIPRGRFCATALACVAAMSLLSGQVRAGDGDSEYVVVKAGRVITVSGAELSPGVVVIEDGKITLVGGAEIEYPPSAKVISAPRETVMPGLIHPRSRYRLPGYRRTGVHGDQKAADEVFLSQMDFTDLLEAGYTTVCFVPAGTGIPGSASAYRTAGPDDARQLSDAAYLYAPLAWRSKGKATLRNALKKAKAEIEKVEKARKEWEKKQEEARKKKEQEEKDKEKEEKPKDDGGEGAGDDKQARGRAGAKGDDEKDKPEGDQKKEDEPKEFKPPSIDPKHKPLVDLIEHKEGAALLIQLSKASDLHHLDDVLEPYDDLVYRLELAGSRQPDFHHVIDALGERKAQTIVRPQIRNLPFTAFRYNLMAKLDRAGCEVSAVPLRDTRDEFLRIRSRLSDLMRAGLPREAAIKSLTLNPARAIGLGDRLGSVEKDKEADLIFFSGDPFDPASKVTRVMILGKVVWTPEETR